jgi:hypothetical protein
MPTAVIERITEVQDKVLELYESAQKPAVEAVRKGVEALERYVPRLPTDKLGEHLPTAREVVDNQFAFAEKLLRSSHEFVGSLLEAAEPVTDKVVKPAPSPATRTTRKAAEKAEAA